MQSSHHKPFSEVSTGPSGWVRIAWTAVMCFLGLSCVFTPFSPKDPNISFSLRVDPDQATVFAGDSVTVELFVRRVQGYNKDVPLGAGLKGIGHMPSGMEYSYRRTGPGGSDLTNALTFRTTAQLQPGTYTLEIEGGPATNPDPFYGGFLYASADFTLHILPPGYGISLSRTSLTIARGSTDTTTVIITRAPNFTEGIEFTEVLDTSIGCTFIPSSTSGNSSTLRLTVSTTAQTGLHYLRVKGTSQPTGLQRFADLSVQVPQGSATLAVTPDYVVTFPGNPATATVSFTRSACTDPVMLYSTYALGNPTFNPNPVPATGNSSVLTLSPLSSSWYQQYLCRIYGNQCSLSGALTYITVMDLPAETAGRLLNLPTQTLLTIGQGQSDSLDIGVLRFIGYAQSVAFTASGTTTGVGASFSPKPVTDDLTTLTLTASPTASGGVIDVIGTGGPSVTSRFTATVRVVPANWPYFNIAPDANTAVSLGQSSSNTVRIQRNNHSLPVNLRVVTTIPGVTTSFSAPSATGNQSVLTLNVARTVPQGLYVISLDGNDGTTVVPAYFTLVVIP